MTYCLYTVPDFITKLTFVSRLMPASGSPDTAAKSANLPASAVDQRDGVDG